MNTPVGVYRNLLGGFLDTDLLARFRQPKSNADFVTFWHGPLDPITYTCLASFPFQGAKLRLYSYEYGVDAPPDVEVADARTIVRDEGLLTRFIVDGRPSVSKFSNYFRYTLLRKTAACWVDADLVCLRKPDFSNDPVVFGQQQKADGPWALNNAVLKLPKRHPMLKELADRAKAAVDLDTKWGVIGPLLITEMARKHELLDKARPQAEFYPVSFGKFWKALLPGYRDHVAKVTADSTFLHLWHEYYRESGYNKQVAPAAGSFLHEWCEKLGTLDRFRRVYRRAELRNVLAAYIKE